MTSGYTISHNGLRGENGATQVLEVTPTSAVPVVSLTPVGPPPSDVPQHTFTQTTELSGIQAISGTQNGIPGVIRNGVLDFPPVVQYAAPNLGITGIKGISPTYEAVIPAYPVSINGVPVGTSYEAVSINGVPVGTSYEAVSINRIPVGTSYEAVSINGIPVGTSYEAVSINGVPVGTSYEAVSINGIPVGTSYEAVSINGVPVGTSYEAVSINGIPVGTSYEAVSINGIPVSQSVSVASSQGSSSSSVSRK